jgi:hypothetical protein
MTPEQKLKSPITLVNRECISTIREALDFYFSLPMHERIETQWTEAVKLLLAALDDENGDALLHLAEQAFRHALSGRIS